MASSRLPLIEVLRRDLRQAVRSLRRDLGSTIFALLIVGCGIGASTTVFSILNGVLLKPLPFKDPKRLVWISNIADDGQSEWRIQVFNYLDLAAQSHTVSDMAAYYAFGGTGNAPLTEHGATRRYTVVPVTCNFFPFLGVTPMIGRSFNADECLPTGPRSVLITEEFWRSHFAADRRIIGRTVTLNDAPATVIGVLPSSFNFPSVFAPGTSSEFFESYPLSAQANNTGNSIAVVGRLAPGATVAQASTELATLGQTITAANRGRRNSIRPRVMALDERVSGRVRPALFMLAAAVIAVMLIACANLSSLQLSRMASRRREVAVRIALGASRGALVRQVLVEALVLSGTGAILGVVLAIVGTRAVAGLGAFDIPLLARVQVDAVALGTTLVIAVTCALIVGLLPAIHMPRDANDGLKEGQRGSTQGGHTRARAILVTSEVAAACMLLVASGLLTRSLLRVLDVQLGYQPEQAFTMRVDPPRKIRDTAAAISYYDDIVRRARAMQGVSSAAIADVVPFGGDRSWGVRADGQAYAPGAPLPEGFVRVVGTGWFATLQIPIKAGRDFDEGDAFGSSRVTIVNETLARMLWPGRAAVGQNLRTGSGLQRVVGVVGDVRHNGLEGSTTGEFYLPLRQHLDYGSVNLVVRAALPMAAVAREARVALASAGPGVAGNEWRPLQALVDKVVSPRRFVVTLLGGFTAFAVLLAALGLYALISYGVSQRSNEIGIRMALGATSHDVSNSVVRSTMILVSMGVAGGIVGSFAIAPVMRTMLFGVPWADPASFGAAIFALFVAALLAAWLPARRAARIDPARVLADG